MRRMLLRMATAIQLTRLTMAFGAVSDLWFIILLTRANERYAGLEVYSTNLMVALFAGAIVAVGLFAYGAALNDVLDVRHDAAFSPSRPIPAGRIRIGQAVVVAHGALIIAVLAANTLGGWSLRLTLLVAAGILFYNAAGRFVPAVGLITIGLIHAGHMLIPNVQLAFMLPVWLVMSHAIGIAFAAHILEDKRPRLRRRTMIVVIVGWATWSGVILAVGAARGDSIWPEGITPVGLLGPALAVIAFLTVAWWKTSGTTAAIGAEKLRRYGAMWQSLYGATWLFALGLVTEGLWIATFAFVGFAAMTLIKELTGLAGRPVTYRA